MSDRLVRLLAYEWLAVPLGLAVAAVALLDLPLSVRALLVLIGAALAVGGIAHLLRLRAARRRFPAPGRLVDLGGFCVHLLAEGDAKGTLPVVLFGGGHSAGLTMAHLHRALRSTTRSILIDRPGTGWSDTGSFPRTTAREADEIVAALERAGEAGPFVLAGHSFGGLLAANIARRRPDLVAALVLLDATPLDALVYGPRLAAIRHMRRDAFRTGLARLVGLDIDLHRRRLERTPGYAQATAAFEHALGDDLTTLRGIELSAGARFADWSILRELDGPHLAGVGWDTVVYDGDLGDTPLWLVAPGSAEEVAAEPELGAAGGADGARLLRFFQLVRERYLAASRDARRIVTPPGSTHQFVYEHPDFVADVLRDAVRSRGSPA